MPPVTVAQVREQVAAVRHKVRDARVIGIRADDWNGPDILDVDRTAYRVAMCRSPLHVREELLDVADGGGLVVLTSVSERDLGGDVLARFAKRQLFEIDTWTIALDLFKARSVDPRIQRARWLADALVESAPPGGYSPTPSGILDADTVWDVLLRLRLGFPDGRPDALALLRWADTQEGQGRYSTISPEFRDGFRRRIAETAGVAGTAMVDALGAGRHDDLVAMGLACRVLYAADFPELRDARVRFEQLHGQRPLSEAAAEQWAEAAERVLSERETADGWPAARVKADAADRLLDQLRAGSFLYLGNWSPTGFEQRLERYASVLAQAIGRAGEGENIEKASGDVLGHRLARAGSIRGRRVSMSLRLVRWLRRTQTDASPTLVQAIQSYCGSSAFVDFARLVLLGGEQPPSLGAAYQELLERVRGRREAENERFGKLLAAAGGSPMPSAAGVVPVEQVLEHVVAPVARAQPTLVLVMDGLSRAVYHDLLDSIADEGWRLWKPEALQATASEWCGLAALPSITEVSRTSLLTGRLSAGDASDERRGFAVHPALLHASSARKPPVLFHKGQLFETSGKALAVEIRDLIASVDQRIVGVVVNVVDDLLFKADQIQPRWTIDVAPLLRELLDAARSAGRAVVLTSDHGHLLDDDSTFLGREAGERWRANSDDLKAGELRIEGRRVLANGQNVAIEPWSERVRYGGRRNGYHGGITPQETILPLIVLSWGPTTPTGFVEASVVHPDWWYDAAVAIRPAPVPVPPSRPAPASRQTVVRPLFDVIEPAVPAPIRATWIDLLFASSRYVEQKQVPAGRGLPSDEEVRGLLSALGERGGKMTRPALSQRVGLSTARLNGLIAATRRLLNVDGLPVLETDVASDTVCLDGRLLEQQFELHQ